MRSGCRRRANEAVESLSPSVDFELLVAEVGDEFDGSAECGDEAVEDVLGGHVAL
jgi:hypothetical protein